MAPVVWYTALGVLALVVLAAGVTDVVLSEQGVETVSDWLRIHRAWYWVPAGTAVALIVLLGIHLFLCPLDPWFSE